MPRIVGRSTAPYSGQEVLDRCTKLADVFRAQGATVVWVLVATPAQPAVPSVVPHDGDVTVVKTSWGAFPSSGIDAELRARDISTVVVGGIATNFGVESTARAADDHGYEVVLVSDAMTGLDAHAHDFAVDYVFPKLGTVVTTEEAITALSAPR